MSFYYRFSLANFVNLFNLQQKLETKYNDPRNRCMAVTAVHSLQQSVDRLMELLKQPLSIIQSEADEIKDEDHR